jgi:hypothetical protein
MTTETDNQTRLRRAAESLAACRLAEDEARKSLALAVNSTKRARQRHSELFEAEENAERKRRQDNYRHETK